MMTEVRRNHPLMMVHEIGKLLRNSFFFFFFLFVIHAGSESWYVVYGRYAFIVLFVLTLLQVPLKWYRHTYQLDETAIHVTKSLISTTKQTVPYSRIQHVHRKTRWFHRFFNVSSVTLETSTQDDDRSLYFPVLKKEQSEAMEQRIQGKREIVEIEAVEASPEPILQPAGGPVMVEEKAPPQQVQAAELKDKHIHFTPGKKETLKASVASLSFLAIIPIAGSILSKVDDLQMEQQLGGIFSFLFESAWMVTLVVVLAVILAAVIGIVKTVVKYGKYEIASTDEKIVITKGVVEEDYFSIDKNKVQAVLIEQTLMKRILGLASLKLVCAGGNGEDTEVSAIYPFLPVNRANSLAEELLPEYHFAKQMEKLPKQALYLRLLKLSWLWIIATGLLYWFKPEPLGMEIPWWLLSLGLGTIILLSRVLNFYQSRYALNERFVQFRSGGFTLTTYLSKRDKIIEMEASRSFIQKQFGLASLNTVNRSNPVRHTAMEDVPEEWAKEVYGWYVERKQEVRVQ
ncbi:hypothetical protein EQV77_06275 [Halobacillus fulvus]|nr:hypothetical protein EQV77_06275 [Halobacillus fulvus]